MVPPRQRFPELDGLRGIAALWVVLSHLTSSMAHFWLKTQPAVAARIEVADIDLYGYLAVDLFFIVSGFVIIMSIDRSRSVSDFAISRFARLFPAYWAAVAISAGFGLLAPLPGHVVTVGQALVNMTMLEEYFRVSFLDPSYWSLSVELGFYALMALIMATGQRHKIETLGLLWVVAGTASQHLLPALGMASPSDVGTGIATYGSLFYAGILFHGIRTIGFTWWRAGGIVLALAARALSLAPEMIAIECVIFVVFALAVAGRLPVLGSRPLLMLGGISYSLYLINQPLSVRLQLLFYELGAPPLLNSAVTLGLVIAGAALLAHLVEHPGAALLRRRITASRAPALVPASGSATRHAG
jgi:peptidoglycan/LPS O-acetylase OafA/YrhL